MFETSTQVTGGLKLAGVSIKKGDGIKIKTFG